MQAADLDDVIANELRAYAFPWTRGIFQECLEGDHDCRVACIDGEIIGHGVASFAAGESHLLNVCIRRKSQGFGYGRELVVHMLKRCRGFGASVLFLEVRPSNVIAGNLYQTLGFNEIGIRRNYYPSHTGHEDARVMVLDLVKFSP